jgi:hypothetical protein
VTDNNANPISAWHGAPSKHLESICWYGLLNVTNHTDKGIFTMHKLCYYLLIILFSTGWYGKGIYLTQKPKYGEYYIEIAKEKTDGQFSLLLCWTLLGRPRAVNKVPPPHPPPHPSMGLDFRYFSNISVVLSICVVIS